MQIVDFTWHPKQRIYSGHARSTRGRQYFFGVSERGQMCWVDRQERDPWNSYWFHLRCGPLDLKRAVRTRLRAERQVRGRAN